MATETESKARKTGVFVKMDPELHRSLKIRAIENGTSLESLVSNILSSGLNLAPNKGENRGRRGRRTE